MDEVGTAADDLRRSQVTVGAGPLEETRLCSHDVGTGATRLWLRPQRGPGLARETAPPVGLDDARLPAMDAPPPLPPQSPPRF